MPRIGDVLADRYRVEALLGAGGMAAVYRAMDLRLAREVAVKVLAPNLAADPAFAARFDREARALAAVAHPNVVAVFDVEPGDPAGGDEPFYVMELCNGGTLGDRLEAAGPIPPAEVVPIIAAVAEGLAALHSRGLVHRDIKPHNILFQDRRAKLGDFGLARSEHTTDSSPLTVPGTTVGTLPFLAPELLAGGAPTQASDVYALGVTAFQALTGRYPKPSDSMREIVEHRHEPPARVSSMVPALGTAYDAPIGRALAEDPAARPSAVTFANSLQAALDSLPPSAFLGGGAAGGAAGAAATGAAAATVPANAAFAAASSVTSAPTNPVQAGKDAG
jgi:serine/threonine protein kinase